MNIQADPDNIQDDIAISLKLFGVGVKETDIQNL